MFWIITACLGFFFAISSFKAQSIILLNPIHSFRSRAPEYDPNLVIWYLPLNYFLESDKGHKSYSVILFLPAEY